MSHVIQLSSGKYFSFTECRPQDIDIRDIAAALSKICRFGGHTRKLYSVAQHSVIVSRLVPPEHRLAGLLHDATEAYIGDMVRPLKNMMPAFEALERDIWAVIANRFGLSFVLDSSIKWADNVALVTEKRDLMPEDNLRDKIEWAATSEFVQLDNTIVPFSSTFAEQMFLKRYTEITGEPI